MLRLVSTSSFNKRMHEQLMLMRQTCGLKVTFGHLTWTFLGSVRETIVRAICRTASLSPWLTCVNSIFFFFFWGMIHLKEKKIIRKVQTVHRDTCVRLSSGFRRGICLIFIKTSEEVLQSYRLSGGQGCRVLWDFVNIEKDRNKFEKLWFEEYEGNILCCYL